MVILSIDTGASMGWALLDSDKSGIPGDDYLIDAGVWNIWDKKDARLKKKGKINSGVRWNRMRDHLDDILKRYYIDVVVFESVRRHKGTHAAHLYGGAVAHLSAWADSELGEDIIGVPVKSVKKYATGNGNASKDEMLTAMNMRFPDFAFVTDDVADAVAIGLYYVNSLGGG